MLLYGELTLTSTTHGDELTVARNAVLARSYCTVCRSKSCDMTAPPPFMMMNCNPSGSLA
jgi:hypothetical protein